MHTVTDGKLSSQVEKGEDSIHKTGQKEVKISLHHSKLKIVIWKTHIRMFCTKLFIDQWSK